MQLLTTSVLELGTSDSDRVRWELMKEKAVIREFHDLETHLNRIRDLKAVCSESPEPLLLGDNQTLLSLSPKLKKICKLKWILNREL